MRTTPRTALVLTGAAVMLVAGITGCSSSSKSPASSSSSAPKNNKVGILLPDTVSSPRWVSADPDELAAQCAKYKLVCTIDNANGSASQMETEAQSMINDGVGVLPVQHFALLGDLEFARKGAGRLRGDRTVRRRSESVV